MGARAGRELHVRRLLCLLLCAVAPGALAEEASERYRFSLELWVAPVLLAPIAWAPAVTPVARVVPGVEGLIGFSRSENLSVGLHVAGYPNRGWEDRRRPADPGIVSLPFAFGAFGELRLPLLRDASRGPVDEVLSAGLFLRAGFPYVRSGLLLRASPFPNWLVGVDVAYEYIFLYGGAQEHSLGATLLAGRRIDF